MDEIAMFMVNGYVIILLLSIAFMIHCVIIAKCIRTQVFECACNVLGSFCLKTKNENFHY
jgi:hypothetical protein